MAMIAAGLVILLGCFVAGTTSEQTEASSTCPPPDPKCDCAPTKDDNGCLVCMCHERIPPAQCPKVKCPIQVDNKECSVEIQEGCRVCNCTPVDASAQSSRTEPSYAAIHV
ncbi:uncharacterized protein LOC119457942 [Dermacentor silvarum]|uniref:uncharacterized protein LOC119457942 n=1 Tax=Dermacentor silvarum TaxID=543639 RepID=UPI00189C3AF0|nr:uncharacterized protein LOC119457942 [Dermacentor silvarum]